MKSSRSRPLDPRVVAVELHQGLFRLARRLRTVELPAGLTQERMSALTAICACGPVSVSSLANIEGVRAATVSRTISVLEAEELVRRGRSDKDGRHVLVTATPRGRRLCQRATDRVIEHLTEALTALEPEQLPVLQRLVEVLGRLN